MKNVIFSVTLVAFALLPVACNSKQEGGTPGTDDKFTLKAPSSETLKQGEKKSVDVTITRGKKFDHDVTLSAKSADDSMLTATIEPKTIKKGDAAKATLTIEADKKAPVKESTVTITATPSGGGNVAPVDVKVTVKENK